MSNNPSPQSRPVNWRAAIVPQDSQQPIHGRISDISEKHAVALFPQSIAARTARLYIDMPDPDRKGRCYLDCKIQISSQTLVGNISEFRLFIQITELDEIQRNLLRRTLKLDRA
ncbi:hypothetical protein [Chitinilyticum aquatile]|uniref:hypothetical protein n=1 Tax=Chitinilyticum aquatile TaxID=362520 RepID=UPI00138AF81C|nr:hypothetical protein [Chitinilyticum aquatile]